MHLSDTGHPVSMRIKGEKGEWVGESRRQGVEKSGEQNKAEALQSGNRKKVFC